MLGELLITLLQSVGIVLLVGILIIAAVTIILLLIFGISSFVRALLEDVNAEDALDWAWDEMCPECQEKLMSLVKGENDEQ